MAEKIYFIPVDTSLSVIKSTHIVEYDDLQKVEDHAPEIKPVKGEFFVRNPSITLQPGDWVVFGVASTPSTDLVNDAIINVKETFGDSLQDFVSSGRIFYEHGYKFAGNKDKHPDIDIPVGKPIAAEIADNKLYVWILLDKNHELAKKIYKHLTSEDPRINRLGLSIGAIPIGKSTTKMINGSFVNVPPKMRLYEVSFTGQPVNTETYAKVLKTLIYNTTEKALQEENMPKDKELETLLEEETKKEETERSDLASLLGEGTDEDTSEETEGATEEATPMTEPMTEPMAEEGQGSEEAPTEELTGEVETEEEQEKEDAQIAYLMDKLDHIEEVLSELETKLLDLENRSEATTRDVGEGLAELKSYQKSASEELNKRLTNIEATIKSLVDLSETNVETVLSLKSLVSSLEALEAKVKSVQDELTTLKSMLSETVQKSASVQTTTTKSVATSNPVVGMKTDAHPLAGMMETTFEQKLKSIQANSTKKKILEEKIKEFLTFKGSPQEISRKKEEIYEFVKKSLDLDPEEFDLIYRQFKNMKNFSKA